MSEISYFQKFSQRENHATNNTLLAFRHMYRVSPIKFENLLFSLLESENEIGIGPKFIQQIKESDSVPDGCIRQSSFAIYIEAKMNGTVDDTQLEAHIKSLSSKSNSYGQIVLVALTTDSLSLSKILFYTQKAAAMGVIFFATTYSQIVNELRNQCRDYEEELISIIADYEKFLQDSNLLYSRDDMMVAVPCGTSMIQNLKYKIYYDPAERSARSGCSYMGFYTNKSISAVGKIKSIACYEYNGGALALVSPEFGKNDDADLKQILEIIEESPYYPNLKTKPTRFYVLEDLHKTNFKKLTTGGMIGARYFNLLQLGMTLQERSSTELVAKFLQTKDY